MRLVFPVHNLRREGDEAGKPIGAVALAAEGVDEDHGLILGRMSLAMSFAFMARVSGVSRYMVVRANSL